MKHYYLLIFLNCLVIYDDNIVLAQRMYKNSLNNITETSEEEMIARDFDPDTTDLQDSLENVFQCKLIESDLTSYLGLVYQTEKNKLIFVKSKSKRGYNKKYLGEFESLKTIRSTKTIRVPRPIVAACTEEKRQEFIVVEYLDMDKLKNKTSTKLGSQLADMHMYNWNRKNSSHKPVNKFGFPVETSTGYIPQNNTWTSDWITFFTNNRMGNQIQLLSSKPDKRSAKIIKTYWPQLKSIIPKFFEGIDVKPSLLHGDLWSGNVAVYDSEPVIFDPASFYGHHEYDIAATTSLAGYSDLFYDAYFKKIPKEKGFENRMALYHLYIYLNQWNLFKGTYMDLVINLFEKLLKMYE